MTEQATAPPEGEAAVPAAASADVDGQAAEAAKTEAAEETISMPRAEADALRRKLAEAEREKRKLAEEQKKAEEARKAEQGQFQELAETRQRELETERAERARAEREQRVTRLASKAKFVDPTDVIGRITADEGADDASVEAALERIAKQSPHLIAKETAQPVIGEVLTPGATGVPGQTADGKPAPPPGKAPLQTLDEAAALPQDEIVARMAEVEWLERQQQ